MRFHKKLNQNRMNLFLKNYQNASQASKGVILILLPVLLCLLYFSTAFSSSIRSVVIKNNPTNDVCMVSYGKYNGHRYHSPTQTLYEKKCLVESKWMRVVQHVVQLNPNADNNANNIIDDWLFIDYHDRINVLVQDPKSTNDDPYFLVFEQTKYSLEGRSSLAVVGGIIEPNESPLMAAKREVYEEMNGLVCQTFIDIGRYRTDVNRGIGWVNGFLARDCSLKTNTAGATADGTNAVDAVAEGEEVGKADMERQDLLSISLEVLKDRVKRGEFLEVQWSNTVALALLHMQ
mmetsp:Transcript_1117/g.2011  ORF Transcript_1117/g.2011 Transcript_1117/m.2011 type:complete len:290 (+) Transcript_1117:90-959(+)